MQQVPRSTCRANVPSAAPDQRCRSWTQELLRQAAQTDVGGRVEAESAQDTVSRLTTVQVHVACPDPSRSTIRQVQGEAAQVQAVQAERFNKPPRRGHRTVGRPSNVPRPSPLSPRSLNNGPGSGRPARLTQQATEVQAGQARLPRPSAFIRSVRLMSTFNDCFGGEEAVEERDVDGAAQQADVVRAVEPGVQDGGRDPRRECWSTTDRRSAVWDNGLIVVNSRLRPELPRSRSPAPASTPPRPWWEAT